MSAAFRLYRWPNVVVVLGVDQFGADRQIVALLDYPAFENGSYPEFPPNDFSIRILSLVMKRGVA
jgi:hypothetical protein